MQYRYVVHSKLVSDIRRIGRSRLVHATDDIDAMVEKLTTAILDAKNLTVPHVKPSKYSLQLPPDIKKLISEKNRLKRQAQRSSRPSTARALMSEVYDLQNLINYEINQLKNNDFARLLEDIVFPDSDHKMFKLAKLLKNRKNKIPQLKNGDELATTPLDKCELLTSQFMENYTNPLENNNKSFTKKVEARAQRYLRRCNVEPNYTNIKEVEDEVRRVKKRKAPGDDGVHNQLIRNLPNTAVHYLMIIINSCMLLSYFPPSWKCAKVSAVKKPGKPANQPSSFRPISLLSCLSKIVERIFLRRLNDALEENNTIPDIQHRFRSGRSTTTQLHQLVSSVKSNLSNSLSTGLVFLDVEKAFDRVWIDGLIVKMIDNNIPAYIIKFAYSFLTNRSFYVYIEGQRSPSKSTKFGLPQGAVLSPVLYSLYTYD